MIDINERIRKLRKTLNLNQTEFGNKIGVKQTTIAGYETGAKNPLDTVIQSICREFNVNENWLRTGEGEDMFIKPSSVSLTYNHFGYIMNNASIRKKAVLAAIIEMVYQYPDDKWDYVFNQFENCLNETRSIKNEPGES